jgi:hypothetical protein
VELCREFCGDLEAAVTAPISFGRFAVLFCLLLVLSAGPIFSTTLPPILDYPNHLARMHILVENGASPTLDQFYAVHWAALPNLAMDVIVPPLARVMPLDLAGRVFILLTFAVIAAGCGALNRVLHGHWSCWSLGIFVVLYNRILLWGFLNYLFGLGLAFGAVALWLASARWSGWQRVVLSVVAVALVYFSHFAAFGVYVLMLAGIEAGPGLALLRQRAWRAIAARLAVLAPQFLLPAAISLSGWGQSVGGKIAYASILRKIDLLFSVFDSYDRPFEVVCFVLFVGMLATLAARRQLGLAPLMRWPLALVVLAYLALPAQLLSGSGADRRMAIVIFMVILAGSLPRLASPRGARVVAGIMILLFGVRLAVFEARWLEADGFYQQDLARLDLLPHGAKLAVVNPGNAIQVGKDPELHLPNLAIIRREAFVSTLFAIAAQQPVALTPPYAALAEATNQPQLWADLVTEPARPAPALLDVLKSYDFIVFIDLKPFLVPETPCLRPVGGGTTLQLFAIEASCPQWQ